MKNRLSGIRDLLGKLYFLAKPYGRGKALLVLGVIVLQGILQVAGVTSVFPFLAVASDPEAFRQSVLGGRLLASFPPISNTDLLIAAGIFSIAVLFLANTSSLLADFARFRYAQGLGHWLRMRLTGQISGQPWSFFLENNTAVLLKKVSSDVRLMVDNAVMPFAEVVSRSVSCLFLVTTLLLVDFRVAIGAALILGLFYAAVFGLLRSWRGKTSYALREADRGAMVSVQQMLGGIKPIKIHGVERFFLRRYAQHSASIARVHSTAPLFFQTPKYLLEPVAFGGLILIVVLYASVGRDFTQIIPLLGVIGLAGYRLLPSVQMLYAEASRMMAMRYAVDEVYDEFRQPAEAAGLNVEVEENRIPPMEWAQDIKLDNVSFSYKGSKQAVISGLSVQIDKNSSVGVIGPTGSGKSTLVDLILGLHRPTAGRILVDGKELTSERIRAWQNGIGYVPQDIFLIDDTVARNIAFGIPDAEIDRRRLREAAEAAQILSFIEKELPDGFDTMVGERGVRLSGGQRQRIALARALYRKPQLLVLDEATSALDNETEAAVVEAINNLQGEVTMLVVAHRLSTIERCDSVLDLGR